MLLLFKFFLILNCSERAVAAGLAETVNRTLTRGKAAVSLSALVVFGTGSVL